MTTTTTTTTTTTSTATYRLVILIALTAMACACRQGDQSAAGKSGAAMSKASQPASPTMDARSQYDLAEAIGTAQAMPPEEAEQRYGEIRDDYQGKRFRWRVYRIPALCSTVERCNVLAFDFSDRDRKNIVQGWMPSLEIGPEALASLDRRCPQGERQCPFEFDGTLDKLVLSNEHLTSLHFSDIHIQ